MWLRQVLMRGIGILYYKPCLSNENFLGQRKKVSDIQVNWLFHLVISGEIVSTVLDQ